MKKLLILILFFSSCSDIFECREPILSENDKEWLPQEGEKWIFSSNNGDTMIYTCTSIISDRMGSVCNDYGLSYGLEGEKNNSYKLSDIFYTAIVNQKSVRGGFIFHTGGTYTEFLIQISQDMGCIDITKERPCNLDFYKNSYFYHSSKELNGTIYEGVIEMNDYEPNRIPEVDISRFYVNQKGILRIEFYSGEVWDRVF